MGKIDKAIEILQAFKDGKTLEYYSNTHQRWFYCNSDNVLLDKIGSGNYKQIRIKKESKYRHYNSAEEFLKASKEHGPYIKCPDGEYIIADRVNIGQIACTRRFYTPENLGLHHQSLVDKSFEDLLKENYTWQDGSPCGVLEE